MDFTEILIAIVIVLSGYILGSIPFGLIFVRLSTGKDIRRVESGRTGGTNALRAAGFWVGAATAICDVLKSTVTVWLARWVLPGATWLQVIAPIMAVLGHNYSVFLIERTDKGTIRLHGGAGGAPTVGGLLGLWPPAFIIAGSIGLLILYFVGYASLTTLCIPLVGIIIFTYRAVLGYSPWAYVVYGIVTEGLLLLALRPNIRRLLNGTERVVGFRARRKQGKLF